MKRQWGADYDRMYIEDLDTVRAMNSKGVTKERFILAGFRQEYLADSPALQAQGITEQAYVAGRCPEEGLQAPGAQTAGESSEARFKAEFAQNPDIHAEMEVSEEQYVRTRMIDEGIAPLR
jgi:hypothetical protein